MSNASMAELEAKSDQKCDERFAAWMKDPLVGICISMIPPAERPESLALLLKAAFRAGFVAGGSDMMGSLLTAMKDNAPKKS